MSHQVKRALVVILFSCAQHADAQVIKPEKTWEGSLQAILSQEYWDIERVYNDKQGKAVVVLRKHSCKPGMIAYCETGSPSFVNTQKAREAIQCFILLQFDWCGIGMPTQF
jgi:hypothetical protein